MQKSSVNVIYVTNVHKCGMRSVKQWITQCVLMDLVNVPFTGDAEKLSHY